MALWTLRWPTSHVAFSTRPYLTGIRKMRLFSSQRICQVWTPITLVIGWSMFSNKDKLIKNSKGMFYIAQYPVLWTTQSYLHFTPRQTCSFRHQLDFYGKHSSHGAITAWILFTHISTIVYSQVLIYTAEWTEASRREGKCPNFETVAKGWFEPGFSRLRVRHSTTELLRSTCPN